MSRIFTIDSIEGNSNLGNPVFSTFGKMTNFHYIVLSPQKLIQPNNQDEEEDETNGNKMSYKVKNPLAADGTSMQTVAERKAKIHDVLVSFFYLIYLFINLIHFYLECI